LKTAIVAQRHGVNATEARQKLIAANGSISTAIQSKPEASATDSSSDLILGIDGGGSHTTALLARLRGNEYEVIGKGRGGPSNLRAVGESAALRALEEATADAFRIAKIPRTPVASVVFGLAGAGREVEQALIKSWARQHNIAQHIDVVSDSSLLLAMLPERWGIAVVAGTGSAVWGRSSDGRTARAGGWGPLLGDEGSGYQIALEALRAVLRQHDGQGEPTILTSLVLERMKLQSPEQIIPAVHGGGWDRARISELAGAVFQAKAEDDRTASHIIFEAACNLIVQLTVVMRKLFVEHESIVDLDAIHVAFCGGLFRNYRPYFDLVVELLNEPQLSRLPLTARQIHLIDEPAEGAVRLAASQL
jgi:N-acetylglucosamine kinase-like BadF-type ATPase